jgi:heat shock protein HslJ
MACTAAHESRVENALLSALARARVWRIDDGTLQLLDARGTSLVQFSQNDVHKER